MREVYDAAWYGGSDRGDVGVPLGRSMSRTHDQRPAQENLPATPAPNVEQGAGGRFRDLLACHVPTHSPVVGTWHAVTRAGSGAVELRPPGKQRPVASASEKHGGWVLTFLLTKERRCVTVSCQLFGLMAVGWWSSRGETGSLLGSCDTRCSCRCARRSNGRFTDGGGLDTRCLRLGRSRLPRDSPVRSVRPGSNAGRSVPGRRRPATGDTGCCRPNGRFGAGHCADRRSRQPGSLSVHAHQPGSVPLGPPASSLLARLCP